MTRKSEDATTPAVVDLLRALVHFVQQDNKTIIWYGWSCRRFFRMFTCVILRDTKTYTSKNREYEQQQYCTVITRYRHIAISPFCQLTKRLQHDDKTRH